MKGRIRKVVYLVKCWICDSDRVIREKLWVLCMDREVFFSVGGGS